MCGNGIRCVAKYVHDHGIARKPTLTIETGAGILAIDLHLGSDQKVSQVTVDMGTPELEAPKIPTTLLNAGHVIDLEVEFAGRPFKATCVSMGNPHCIVFLDDASDDVVLDIGPQIECDPRFPNRTNIEFVLTNRTERRITNHLLGGDLVLEWNETDNHVMMTGPASEVFSGTWEC